MIVLFLICSYSFFVAYFMSIVLSHFFLFFRCFPFIFHVLLFYYFFLICLFPLSFHIFLCRWLAVVRFFLVRSFLFIIFCMFILIILWFLSGLCFLDKFFSFDFSRCFSYRVVKYLPCEWFYLIKFISLECD